jgi:hypothetical protein
VVAILDSVSWIVAVLVGSAALGGLIGRSYQVLLKSDFRVESDAERDIRIQVSTTVGSLIGLGLAICGLTFAAVIEGLT